MHSANFVIRLSSLLALLIVLLLVWAYPFLTQAPSSPLVGLLSVSALMFTLAAVSGTRAYSAALLGTAVTILILTGSISITTWGMGVLAASALGVLGLIYTVPTEASAKQERRKRVYFIILGSVVGGIVWFGVLALTP
jgi:hypothetical protein